jgi:hypothetical protein
VNKGEKHTLESTNFSNFGVTSLSDESLCCGDHRGRAVDSVNATIASGERLCNLEVEDAVCSLA